MRQIEIFADESFCQFGWRAESYNALFEEAKRRSKKMASKLVMRPGDYGFVTFWTKGYPDLICTTKFICLDNGNIVCEYDNSQSPLNWP